MWQIKRKMNIIKTYKMTLSNLKFMIQKKWKGKELKIWNSNSKLFKI